MKTRWMFLLLISLAVRGEFSAWLAPEVAAHIESNRHLCQGGCKLFDDCAVAVGSSNYRPGLEMLAESVAHANARAELAGLLQGAHVKAVDTVEENLTSVNGRDTLQSRSVSEVTSTIERLRQAAIRPGGTWLSPDGKTLFLCIFAMKNDTPGKVQVEAELPDFVQDWDVEPQWEALFRSATGILKGGATLICDDYGEQFLLVVSTCPASESFHKRRIILHSKALGAAVAYTKGTILNDMRYLKESLQNNEDDSGNLENECQITVRHIQRRLTQGNLKGLQDAGGWAIDGGQRVCGAFIVRLSDLDQESNELELAGTSSSQETLEIDLADAQAAALLQQEIRKATVQETEEQIVLELPENSPLFGKGENEIVIVDNLVMPVPLPAPSISIQPQIVLWQPQRFCARIRRPQRHSRIIYRPSPRKIVRPVPRVYLPARCHRVPGPHGRHHGGPPKPILLRRGRHHAPPPHAHRPPHRPPPRVPRFRFRCPNRK